MLQSLTETFDETDLLAVVAVAEMSGAVHNERLREELRGTLGRALRIITPQPNESRTKRRQPAVLVAPRRS